MSDITKMKQAAEICNRGIAMIDEEIENMKPSQESERNKEVLLLVREELEVMKQCRGMGDRAPAPPPPSLGRGAEASRYSRILWDSFDDDSTLVNHLVEIQNQYELIWRKEQKERNK
ncbi:MAG: hypothetical protein MPJ24_08540, partial [Pirellulaceae bacterium]|nr:hypothetical protein [Pirellulaceae bacterium]